MTVSKTRGVLYQLARFLGDHQAVARIGKRLARRPPRAFGDQIEGVADVGFALSAWFVDPDGNTIGLIQFKDTRQEGAL